MHRVFISYHHENDQQYKAMLVAFAEKNQIFIDTSVDTDEIPDYLDDESIREKIRDEYLRDSTVTIVLVGTETRNRKHVDWEIYSSMFDGTVNKKSGIVVIMLPEVDGCLVKVSHGQKEKDLYPGMEWESVDSQAEYERRYPQMPARLIDNLLKSESKISVVPWTKIINDADLLRSLIDMAYDDRAQCKYDLSRQMRRANS